MKLIATTCLIAALAFLTGFAAGRFTRRPARHDRPTGAFEQMRGVASAIDTKNARLDRRVERIEERLGRLESRASRRRPGLPSQRELAARR